MGLKGEGCDIFFRGLRLSPTSASNPCQQNTSPKSASIFYGNALFPLVTKGVSAFRLEMTKAAIAYMISGKLVVCLVMLSLCRLSSLISYAAES